MNSHRVIIAIIELIFAMMASAATGKAVDSLDIEFTKVSHLPFYWLSRIIKHCNILIDNLLTFCK